MCNKKDQAGNLKQFSCLAFLFRNICKINLLDKKYVKIYYININKVK